jgi:hypothetical protein
MPGWVIAGVVGVLAFAALAFVVVMAWKVIKFLKNLIL